MNYELFLARKLTLSSGGRKSSPAVRVATAAVALSIAVMLAAVAIVSGFRQEITRKVVGFNSDLQISLVSDNGEENLVTLFPSFTSLLDTISSIEDYSLQISVPAVLKTPGDFKGVYLRSSSDRPTREFLQTNMESGRVASDTATEVTISSLAANKLNLKTGDRVDAYFFTDDVRVRRLTISGVYNTHFDHYDDVTAYMPLPLIQQVTGLKSNQGSSIKAKVKDFSLLEQTRTDVQQTLDRAVAEGVIYRPLRVTSAAETGAGFFQWLRLLDTNVIVILTLMSIVGCVTLISGMLIMILDKKRFIGLLKALGASTKSVRKVFIWLAVRVALRGMIIGNLIMIGLLCLQDTTHFIRLDADSYYIDFVPVAINWLDILLLNAVVALIIYLSLILPSRFVAGISPSETMRYE